MDAQLGSGLRGGRYFFGCDSVICQEAPDDEALSALKRWARRWRHRNIGRSAAGVHFGKAHAYTGKLIFDKREPSSFGTALRRFTQNGSI